MHTPVDDRNRRAMYKYHMNKGASNLPRITQLCDGPVIVITKSTIEKQTDEFEILISGRKRFRFFGWLHRVTRPVKWKRPTEQNGAVSLSPIPYPGDALTGEDKAAILAGDDWPASRTPYR
jgi:hypothetical protein